MGLGAWHRIVSNYDLSGLYLYLQVFPGATYRFLYKFRTGFMRFSLFLNVLLAVMRTSSVFTHHWGVRCSPPSLLLGCTDSPRHLLLGSSPWRLAMTSRFRKLDRLPKDTSLSRLHFRPLSRWPRLYLKLSLEFDDSSSRLHFAVVAQIPYQVKGLSPFWT